MSRIDNLKRMVTEIYQQQNPDRADWSDWLFKNHVFLVSDECKKLSTRFGVHTDLAEASGMLHDIADSVTKRDSLEHEHLCIEIATDLLKKSDFNKQEIEEIVDGLKYHGCKNGQLPNYESGKILATADAVVHLISDFYNFYKNSYGKSSEETKISALKKIDRDFNKEILFPEIKTEMKLCYNNCINLFN